MHHPLCQRLARTAGLRDTEAEVIAMKKLRRPGSGPISGLPSGEYGMGPFTPRLMPARASAGTRAMASSIYCSSRSKSSFQSWLAKSSGMPSSHMGVAFHS